MFISHRSSCVCTCQSSSPVTTQLEQSKQGQLFGLGVSEGSSRSWDNPNKGSCLGSGFQRVHPAVVGAFALKLVARHSTMAGNKSGPKGLTTHGGKEIKT